MQKARLFGKEGLAQAMRAELPEYAVYELSVLRDVNFPQPNPDIYKGKARKPEADSRELPSRRVELLYTDRFFRLTIISKEEKARRRAEKGQLGHEKRVAYRKDKKRRRNEEILTAQHADLNTQNRPVYE